MPLVSVIIPNYNHAPYLRKRIDTILAQTWSELEVIIIDDCSTDDSRNIIETYRHHPRITQIIYNTTNGGTPFKQWKRGIEAAAGEWINIAESDDWCEPTHLETIMLGILQKPDCIFGFGQTFTVVNNNEFINVPRPVALHQWHDGKTFLKTRVIYGEPITAGMVIFKKSAYESSLDFENYRTAGDQKFYMHLVHKGVVFESGAILHYCRRHGTNTNSKPENRWHSRIESLQTFKWAKQQQLLDESNLKNAAVTAASHILRSGGAGPKESLVLLKKEIVAIYPTAFMKARHKLLLKDIRLKLNNLIRG
jgi:glycosyltransferase involved in cell wall biosynthesis